MVSLSVSVELELKLADVSLDCKRRLRRELLLLESQSKPNISTNKLDKIPILVLDNSESTPKTPVSADVMAYHKHKIWFSSHGKKTNSEREQRRKKLNCCIFITEINIVTNYIK